MDRKIAHEWAGECYEPYVDGRGTNRDRVLFMDNLDAQVWHALRAASRARGRVARSRHTCVCVCRCTSLSRLPYCTGRRCSQISRPG